MRNTTMIRRLLTGFSALVLAVALGACADQPMEVEAPVEMQMDDASSGNCVMVEGRLVCM